MRQGNGGGSVRRLSGEKAGKRETSHRPSHGRLLTMVVLCMLAVLGLAGRLVYLQGLNSAALAEQAAAYRTRVHELQPDRGRILDRRGTVLAANQPTGTIFADPSVVEDAAKAAHLLAPLLGRPEEDVRKDLADRNVRFVYLKRNLDLDKVRQIEQLKLKGIADMPDYKRFYPEGQLAAQVMGFVDIDHKGREGLEAAFDQKLAGVPGSFTAEFTPDGYLIAGSDARIVPQKPGLTLQTTLDARLNHLAEQVLAEHLKLSGAKRGLVAVEDPHTGEILALAMAPTFDPNTYLHLTATPDLIRNWAVADALSPGSIFKPITAAMALDEKKLTPTTPIRDPGYLRFPGHTIENFEPGDNGYITVAQALQISSNVGMGQVSGMVGTDRFYDYLHLFNLDRPTGFDGAAGTESTSIMIEKSKVKPLDQALMGIGQSINVTPMQVLAAEAAIANDGVWVQPHLAKAWLNPDGTPAAAPTAPEQRQVVSKQTAQDVRDGMKLVLQDTRTTTGLLGTGTLAQVPGYTIAGKTGTAEMFDPKDGHLLRDKYLASFVGFVPADRPQLVVLVMLDQPTAHEGLAGLNSAPFFADFMKEALQLLEIPPDAKDAPLSKPIKQTVCRVPNLKGMEVTAATQTAHSAHYRLVIQGEGMQITAQQNAPGDQVACNTELVMTAGGPPPPAPDPGPRVRLPDLWQMPLTQAAEALSGAGLISDLNGSGLAASQSPAAGSLVPRGTRVHVVMVPASP